MATITITATTANYVVSASDTTLINLGTIGGTVGIDVLSGLSGDVVVNAAMIAVGGLGLGVRLSSASSLTNQSGGTISGYKAIIAYNDPSTVTNYGVVAGSEAVQGAGVQFISGGALTNQSSAVVYGYSGVIANAGGTV